MLLRPLDACLSSQSKVRLLRALLPLEDAVSAREAARLARIALAPALRALADLVALAVLRRTELARQHLYTVNHQNPLVREGLIPLFEAERARVRAIFDSLREALEAEVARGTVRTLAVYGSAARGEDGPGSDLDLLVVTDEEDEVPQVHSTLARMAQVLESNFGLDLSPMVVSQEQLRHQYTMGDPVTVSAMHDVRMIVGIPLDRLLLHTGNL